MANKNVIPLSHVLPMEIVVNIFRRLPSDIIYDIARHDQDWSTMIERPGFINSHLDSSATRGLLLVENHYARFLGDVGVKEIDMIPPKGILIGCCDGLVLIQDDVSMVYIVKNLATKAQVTLPRLLLVHHGHLHNFTSLGAAIGCSGDRTHDHLISVVNEKDYGYKVVRAVICDDCSKGVELFVLTVGIERRWRKLASIAKQNFGYFDQPSLSIGGFIYWHHDKGRFVFALDVESEELRRVYPPQEFTSRPDLTYIKSERFLLLPVATEHSTSFVLWEFWGLVDTRNNKWTKIFGVNINLKYWRYQHGSSRTHFCTSCTVNPVEVLRFKGEDVVVFYCSLGCRVFVGYGVESNNVFEFPGYPTTRRPIGHVESLVKLKTYRDSSSISIRGRQ